MPINEPNAPVRIGLVGVGWGTQVAEAIKGSPLVEVFACYSRSEESRTSFSRAFHCVNCQSFAELIGLPELDGIVLMTPNSLHAEHAVAALRANKHVLVTKPIATKLSDAELMIATAKKENRILAVGHQNRHHRAIRCLKQLVEDGSVGTPRIIEGNTSSPTGLNLSPHNWRRKNEECPGGPLINLGIHYVDNFQYILGPIHSVQAQGCITRKCPIKPATVITQFSWNSEIQGSLVSSYSTPYTRWIRISCSDAIVWFDIERGLYLRRSGNTNWENIILPDGDKKQETSRLLRVEMEEFANCIRFGENPEIDGQTGWRNLAVVLAAVESMERGKPILVPKFDENRDLEQGA